MISILRPSSLSKLTSSGKSTKLGEKMKELIVTNQKKNAEINELNKQLATLQKVKSDYLSSLMDTKKSHESYIEKRQELERQIRSDEKISRLKEMSDMRQQWIRDQSLEKDHELNKQQRAIEDAINDNENKRNNLKLKDILAKSGDFQRPKRNNSSQTGWDGLNCFL
jgi:chromosome segregation ATPase